MIDNLINKKVFLAPKNSATILLYAKLRKNKVNVVGFIDNYKVEKDTFRMDDVLKVDYIIVYSPRYYLEIIEKVPLFKVVIIYDVNSLSYIIPNRITKYIPYLFYKMSYLNTLLFNLKNNISFYLYEKFNLVITKNIKNIRSLKPISERVFIIGNGPSLNIKDLDQIRNETTIASNKIFLAFEITEWRPTYYTIEDPLDIEEYYSKIFGYNLGIRFFPLKYNIKKDRESIYYRQLSSKDYKSWEPSTNLLKGLYGGESVAMTMIQFAMSLSAKEIYLIGFDHHYEIVNSEKDTVYKIASDEKNHFHKDYRKKGDIWTEPRLENITLQFQILKEYSDRNQIKIYNATRGGKLEVFPRVKLEEIINRCI